jgi:hypothetical protein
MLATEASSILLLRSYNYAQHKKQIQTTGENKWYQKCVNYEAAVIKKYVACKCNGRF